MDSILLVELRRLRQQLAGSLKADVDRLARVEAERIEKRREAGKYDKRRQAWGRAKPGTKRAKKARHAAYKAAEARRSLKYGQSTRDIERDIAAAEVEIATLDKALGLMEQGGSVLSLDGDEQSTLADCLKAAVRGCDLDLSCREMEINLGAMLNGRRPRDDGRVKKARARLTALKEAVEPMLAELGR